MAHGGTLEASAGSDLVTLQAEMPRTSRAVAAADAMIGLAN